MLLQRLDGILRTTRIIAARRREQRRERHLITPHQEYEYRAHPTSLRRLRAREVAAKSALHRQNIGSECGESGGICVDARANDDVDRRPRFERGKKVDAHELPDPPLEAVPVHCALSMTRYDDAHARM
jgi:hypothetical protein